MNSEKVLSSCVTGTVLKDPEMPSHAIVPVLLLKLQLQTGERPVIFFTLANRIALQLLRQPVPTLQFTTFGVNT